MSAIISVHGGADNKYDHRFRIVGADYVEMHLDGEQASCSFYLHDVENLKAIGETFLKAAKELDEAKLQSFMEKREAASLGIQAQKPKEEEIPF